MSTTVCMDILYVYFCVCGRNDFIVVSFHVV